MTVHVYFLDEKTNKKQASLVSLNPVGIESHYFMLCRDFLHQKGQVIVDSSCPTVPQGCFLTGDHPDRGEQDPIRRHMIWPETVDEWLKPTPFQIRGLTSAWYGKKRGAQSAFAESLGVNKRTWRNWAKIINNKKIIPWHAWQLMLIMAGLHPEYKKVDLAKNQNT